MVVGTPHQDKGAGAEGCSQDYNWFAALVLRSRQAYRGVI